MSKVNKKAKAAEALLSSSSSSGIGSSAKSSQVSSASSIKLEAAVENGPSDSNNNISSKQIPVNDAPAADSPQQQSTETTDAVAVAGQDEAGEANDNNELILIQDNAFVVKIQVPGLEPFDLQVTSMELVQEIHQMLMDKEETCHRTCFSLQVDGCVLDNFSELKAIDGIKEGCVIKLVDGKKRSAFPSQKII